MARTCSCSAAGSWPIAAGLGVTCMEPAPAAALGWAYPVACEHGHEWGPGLVLVGWQSCSCPTARADLPKGWGHVVVHCDAAPGCESRWYRPPCDWAWPSAGGLG